MDPSPGLSVSSYRRIKFYQLARIYPGPAMFSENQNLAAKPT